MYFLEHVILYHVIFDKADEQFIGLDWITLLANRFQICVKLTIAWFLGAIRRKYHSWYFKSLPNFPRLQAREIMWNNFEMPLQIILLSSCAFNFIIGALALVVRDSTNTRISFFKMLFDREVDKWEKMPPRGCIRAFDRFFMTPAE